MKTIVKMILVLIMFIPLLVGAEECDISKVYIDSISVEDISNVEELDEAVASDKTISLNLGMHNVGDNIRYKLVIKNDSNEDYELDEDNLNINSDYIDYKLELDNDSKIVGKKSSKIVYLSVQYKNEVPEEEYDNGIFTNDVTIKVSLSENESQNILNPNTGKKNLLIMCLILIIGGGLYFIFRKDKTTKVVVLVVVTLLLIPVAAKALCKYELDIHSSVTIDNRTYVYSDYNQYIGEPLNREYPVFDNFEEALAGYGDDYHDFIVRLAIDENDIVLAADLAFKINDKVYYLNGGDPKIDYESRIDYINNIFGIDNCGIENDYYKCTNDSLKVLVYDIGFVSISDANPFYCVIDPRSSRSFCDDD